eukprot:TRINITY_DN1245_c0_g1_i1.p1 TRINITY_DN1245_c0_g1~~TRINITY_DN1245_c0_g1_i1.p1  ORF type:complete len:582 (-),score=195.00 TRINITY_DN1245_c0_g1_i1:830-2575(-)
MKIQPAKPDYLQKLKAIWKSREQEEEERKQRLEELNRQLDPTANNPSGTFTPKFPEKWVKMRNPERLQPLMQMHPPPGSKLRGRLWEYNPNDYASNYEILRLNLKPCWPQFLLWSLDENETEKIAEEKRREAAESAAKAAEKLSSSSKKRKRVEEQFDLSELPVEASRAVLKQKAAAAGKTAQAPQQHQDLSQEDDGGFEIAKLDDDSSGDFTSDRGGDDSSSSSDDEAGATESLQDLSALMAPENIPENDPIRKEFVKEKKKVLGIISAMFSDDDSQEEPMVPPSKKRRLSASSSSSSSSASSSDSDEEPAPKAAVAKSSSTSSSSSRPSSKSSSSSSSKSSSRSTSSGSASSSSSDDDAMAVDEADAAEQESSSAESSSSSSSSSSSDVATSTAVNVKPKEKVVDAAQDKVPEFSIERQDIGDVGGSLFGMTAGKKVASVSTWTLFGNNSAAAASTPSTEPVEPQAQPTLPSSTLPASATQPIKISTLLKNKSRQEAFGLAAPAAEKRDLSKVPRFMFNFIRPDEAPKAPEKPFIRMLTEAEIDEEFKNFKRLLRKDALKKHRHAQKRLKAGSKSKIAE